MVGTETSPATWRLIVSDPCDGTTNMAVDQAIAEATILTEAPPTLRLYGWEPPCLSLGRNQPCDDVDSGRCLELGFDTVRRATGGRAILHVDELTYSVAGPAAEPRLRGGVLEVYQRLSAGLIDGLRRMGIEALTAPRVSQEGEVVTAACFDVPSAHEVTVGERKLVGSAQCRQAGWVLQHGSLPLGGDVARIVDCLAFDSEEERESLRQALRQRAVTAAQVLGMDLSFERSAEALAEGFSTSLHVELRSDTLTPWERDRSEELRATRYANEAWTLRR